MIKVMTINDYEELWTALLDHATVYTKDDIHFTFKNGFEVSS